MGNQKSVVFVAYSSGDEHVSQTIFSAVQRANAKPLPVI